MVFRTAQGRILMFRKPIASLTVILAVTSTSVLAHEARQQAAVSTSELASTAYAFPLPEAGSYKLPPIKRAAGGRVLDENGGTFDLADFYTGRITVLAFIYTRCGDICPVASLQLSLLQDLAAKKPEVAHQMRLISMSFDPEYDTPKVMAEHAEVWRSQAPEAPDWLFLTAPDREAVAPILAAYDQTIAPKRDHNSSTGQFYHIFRGFLVDASGRIRNIYSLDFLDPRLVLNDIQTLLLELAPNPDRRSAR
jgi:protein SCO1/2